MAADSAWRNGVFCLLSAKFNHFLVNAITEILSEDIFYEPFYMKY